MHTHSLAIHKVINFYFIRYTDPLLITPEATLARFKSSVYTLYSDDEDHVPE
jgi:hypothetical protein